MLRFVDLKNDFSDTLPVCHPSDSDSDSDYPSDFVTHQTYVRLHGFLNALVDSSGFGAEMEFITSAPVLLGQVRL